MNRKSDLKKQLLKKCIFCVLFLLINVALLVTTTYAWFSDQAMNKNNKVFAGNLLTDILINESDLKENLVKSNIITDSDPIPEYLNDFKYVRTFKDDTIQTYYYASRIPSVINLNGDETSIDTSILNISMLEPGQAFRVPVNVMASGDLAIKAAGALKVEENKTGLDIFIEEHPNIEADLQAAIDDPSTPTGKASSSDDIHLLNSLLSMQATVTDKASESTKTFNGKYFIDNGGELEDAIIVYLLEEVGSDIEVDRDSLELDKVFLNKLYEVKNERFFGTLRQFEYLITYGSQANVDNGTPKALNLICDAYNYNTRNILPEKGDMDDNIYNEYLAELENTVLSYNEEYMALHNSYDANLYADYNRYLSYASGYCIPYDAIADDGKLNKDGIKVDVKDGDGKLLYTKEGLSEIDTINFLLYMPLDASNEYQYASTTLSLGATATQVEYEIDDTGCMIYDKSSVINHSHEYTTINYLDDNGDVKSIKIPKISYVGNVSFDAGDHGEYEVVPSYDIASSDIIDLSSSEYRPKTNQRYRFIGYKFNENEKQFICCYEFATPYKGDIIILNDGKKYRVLKVNGTKIFVMGMENSDSKLAGLVETKKYDDLRFPVGDGLVAIKYDGLDIDTYLNETWYSSLNDGDTIPMYSAIEDTHIYQNVYSQYTNPLDGNSIIHTFDVGNRKVFAIDISDIYEYFGKDTLNQDELYEFFYGDIKIENLDKPISIWLRSSSTTGEAINIFAVKADNSKEISYNAADQEAYIRPAFVIDLSNDGVSYRYPTHK